MRSLVECEFLSMAQAAEIAGMSESECKKVLHGEDGAKLTMANVDNISDFFGFSMFKTRFFRELFAPRGSPNRSWDDLTDAQKKIINITDTYANDFAVYTPVDFLSYVSEMRGFLDTCSTMKELIVASEEEHDQDDTDLKSSNKSTIDADATVASV